MFESITSGLGLVKSPLCAWRSHRETNFRQVWSNKVLRLAIAHNCKPELSWFLITSHLNCHSDKLVILFKFDGATINTRIAIDHILLPITILDPESLHVGAILLEDCDLFYGLVLQCQGFPFMPL